MIECRGADFSVHPLAEIYHVEPDYLASANDDPEPISQNIFTDKRSILVCESWPPLFVYFRLFLHDTIQIQIDKNVEGVLRTQIQGGNMEGAEESTELWWHPLPNFCPKRTSS